jgi:hypothetical protein
MSLRKLALETRDLPYDQRGYYLFENRDVAHEAGVDPQALQDFDPTDEALAVVLGQADPQPNRQLRLASFGGPNSAPEGLPPRNRTGGYLYPPPADQRRLNTMPGPPGVDIDANIREAEAHQGNLPWFYGKVHGSGPRDYKHGQSRAHGPDGEIPMKPYEAFGNYHYGATGSALGLSPELLLRAAGAQQYLGRNPRPSFGKPWGAPPYGDDPHDGQNIQLGIEYYQRQHDAAGRSRGRGN